MSTCLAHEKDTLSIKGLATKEVYQVMCDKKGFIWVGHELGISRYDGLQFKHFHNPQLASVSVSNLIEDEDGRIWGMNFSGQILYIENNKLNVVEGYPFEKENFYPKLVLYNNQIIATSKRGICVINVASKKCVFVSLNQNNQPIGEIFSTVVYKNQVICHGLSGFYLYNSNKNYLTTLNAPSVLPQSTSYALLLNKAVDTAYYFKYTVGANTQLFTLDIAKNTVIIKNQALYSGSYMGCSWVNSLQNGIYLHTTSEIAAIEAKKTKQVGYIASIDIDFEGNTWLASTTKGLLFVKKRKLQFETASPNLKTDDKVVAALYKSNYNLFATNKGKILYKTNATYKEWLLDAEDALVNLLHETSNGKIIIATSKHLYILDLNNKSITKSRFLGNVVDISENNSSLFFATSAGIFACTKADLFSNKNMPTYLTGFLEKNENYSFLNDNIGFNNRLMRTRAVLFDSVTNKLWVAFKIGLYCFHNKKVEEIKYHNKSIYATHLTTDSKGNLWVGTTSAGVFVVNNENTVTNFSKSEGLTHNTILFIKNVSQKIWIVSVNNIHYFDCNNQQISKQLLIGEIKGSDVTDVFFYNNQWKLLTKQGLINIDEEVKNTNKTIRPKNYIEAITVNYKDSLPINKSNFQLKYNQNNLQFFVTALWYNDPEQVYFRYKLLGKDQENVWQKTNFKQQLINFNNLKPGKYTIYINAVTFDGLKGDQMLMYSFEINNAIWQRWWFIACIIILLVASITLFVRWRFARLNKQNKLEVEKIQLEVALRNSMLSAMKSQLNPHFIFNALNTIQSYIYANDRKKAISYLGKFSNLIRIILSASNKKQITLAEEIEMLELYVSLEEMRFEDNFSYLFYVDNQ
ncbi:MAG: histidine kinase, partial [Chitinophagaceae bacterium]